MKLWTDGRIIDAEVLNIGVDDRVIVCGICQRLEKEVVGELAGLDAAHFDPQCQLRRVGLIGERVLNDTLCFLRDGEHCKIG